MHSKYIKFISICTFSTVAVLAMPPSIAYECLFLKSNTEENARICHGSQQSRISYGAAMPLIYATPRMSLWTADTASDGLSRLAIRPELDTTIFCYESDL
jgi:hypothetical protein